MTSDQPSFEQLWADLLPLGRTADGGYRRLPYDSAERECDAWFVEQVTRRGLDLQTDRYGNRIAWWRPEGANGPGVLTGSHLDSVLDGGAFDGPLGVISALAAVDRLQASGTKINRPIGVGVFVAEEGSRFGLACLGSRLAAGQLDASSAEALVDQQGRRLGDLVPITDTGATDAALLADVGSFVELHVEQGRGLADTDHAVALASGIWPHGRYRYDFVGAADHAGATRMEDRQDPMLTYAMTALAANKQARVSGARATFGRIVVEPNQTNAIPSSVTGWLDARAASEQTLADLVDKITSQADDRAGRDGTRVEMTAESISPAVGFDPILINRLAVVLGGSSSAGAVPVLPSQAGHDAGILAAAGIPTAMLFVRNPTGASHTPAETASTTDCLAGVEALVAVLTELAG